MEHIRAKLIWLFFRPTWPTYHIQKEFSKMQDDNSWSWWHVEYWIYTQCSSLNTSRYTRLTLLHRGQCSISILRIQGTPSRKTMHELKLIVDPPHWTFRSTGPICIEFWEQIYTEVQVQGCLQWSRLQGAPGKHTKGWHVYYFSSPNVKPNILLSFETQISRLF